MTRKLMPALLLFALISIPFQFSATLHAQYSDAASTPAAASTVPDSHLIQPPDLVRLLHGSTHPLLLHVGSHVMFTQARIPGSLYAGPGSRQSGLTLLEHAAASSPKDRLIVLYCGCCPWGHCPNVGPAYKHLADLGFTNVKVLYLANNFGDDWVAKGYPVDKGE